MEHSDLILNDKDLQYKIQTFIDEYFTSNDKKLLANSIFRVDLCSFDVDKIPSNALAVFTSVFLRNKNGEIEGHKAILLRPKFKNTTCNNTIAHELTHLVCWLRNDVTNDNSYRKNNGRYSGHGPSFFKIGDELFAKDYTVLGEETDYDTLSFEIKKAKNDKWWTRFKWIFNEVNYLYDVGTFTKTEKIELQNVIIDILLKNKQDNIVEELLS